MKAYFDRNKASINGWFTVQTGNGEKLINRVEARSGQSGHTNNSWTRGKSPIPFSTEVVQYYLYTRPNNQGQEAGATGIGEAYPIDTQADKMTVKEKNGKRIRTEIMVHQENKWAGSAGCIVIVNDDDWEAFKRLMAQLRMDGITKIPLEVL